MSITGVIFTPLKIERIYIKMGLLTNMQLLDDVNITIMILESVHSTR
jgi:hypothetical protein